VPHVAPKVDDYYTNNSILDISDELYMSKRALYGVWQWLM